MRFNLFKYFHYTLVAVLIVILLFSNSSLFTKITPEAELGFIPIPSNLSGYRTFNSTRLPRIKVTSIEGKLGNPRSNPEMKITIDAPLAVEMKLSDDPNFKDAPWRKVDSGIPWVSRLKPNQDVYTIYAVFRYRNVANNRFEISPVVHDSIKTDAPYKKITRTVAGYFDWYDMKLIVQSESSKKSAEQDFYILQQAIESSNTRVAYLHLEKIPLVSGYTLKDFLYLNPDYINLIPDVLGNMKLLKAYYPTTESILVEQELYLLNPTNLPPRPQTELSFYQYVLKNIFKRKPASKYQDFGSDPVLHLIIDVRNQKAQQVNPAWFWKIVDDENKVIFTPAFHNNPEVPFIRYLRDLKYFNVPKNTLVVKATDVNNIENSISILPFYGKILLSRQDQLEHIANGNFYILTD